MAFCAAASTAILFIHSGWSQTPPAAAPTPAKRNISLDDLAKIGRVGSPVISKDGAWVIYSVSRPDLKEDKNHADLWMERWDGSGNMQLTFGKEGASKPQFSPDGKYISFSLLTTRQSQRPRRSGC